LVREIGPIARPRRVVIVPDMPKTRSGKIMRRVLAAISNNEDAGDISTLANPEIEMQGQAAAAIDTRHQVLAMAPRCNEARALQAGSERSNRKLAEDARIADSDAADRLAQPPPYDYTLEAFDVGQFRHCIVRVFCSQVARQFTTARARRASDRTDNVKIGGARRRLFKKSITCTLLPERMVLQNKVSRQIPSASALLGAVVFIE
jgi:hypothetical protein